MIALYPRLALTGIRKNKKLYFPYILTCIGMVMMYYIIHSLSFSPTLLEMRGGGVLESILGLGKFVIAAFSVLFLLYTNSFLIRRRNREFGLYHVLGMGKGGLTRIMVWESLIVTVVSIAFGISLGIAFSKLAELLLLNIVQEKVNYQMSVSPECLVDTLEMYGCIFLLLLVKSIVTVYRSDPLALLHSESVGEKPPKSNALLALAGLVLLGVAYYFALTIGDPATAVMLFFVLVLMVIAATYLLFIAGSVTLCRALQKNRRFYYQKNHFVSVSTMAYRMKRNGAGLASICILSTMVLVMLSSTTSLYIGQEDSVAQRYPRDNEIDLNLDRFQDYSEERISQVRDAYGEVFSREGVTPKDVLDFRYAYLSGVLMDTVDPNPGKDELYDETGDPTTLYERLRLLVFVTAEEYNRVTGASLTLNPGEAYMTTVRGTYDRSTISIRDVSFRIVGSVTDYPTIGEVNVMITPAILLVIPSMEELAPLAGEVKNDGRPILNLKWCYAYDLDVEAGQQIDVLYAQKDALENVDFLMENGFGFRSSSKAEARQDFYMTFGSLFFVGILLSIVFLAAAALIIYYKQISEGYEDQARFAILQKVGMTGRDIRKSINSQVLIVFFAPLLAAGLHMTFAFPMVWTMLQAFNMRNMTLIALVTLGVFFLFGIFYAVIYRMTAGAYYGIVSGGKRENA